MTDRAADIAQAILSGRDSAVADLSPQERQYLIKSLKELNAGESGLLDTLWGVDYSEKPLSVDEFLDDPYYFGQVGKSVYPVWRAELRRVLDPANEITEWVVSGSIGCLTGDTRVRLLDGSERTLRELTESYDGTPFWVYSFDIEKGEIVPGLATNPVVSGVTDDIWEVILDNGESVRGTHDHPFLLRDGTYRKLCDLQPGDSLTPLYTRFNERGYEEVLYDLEHWYQTHWVVMWWLNRGYKSFPRIDARCGNVIHHRNCDKTDNRPDNLELMSWFAHRDWHSAHTHLTIHRPESKKKVAEHSRALMKKFNIDPVMVAKQQASKRANGSYERLSERTKELNRIHPRRRDDVQFPDILQAILEGSYTLDGISSSLRCSPQRVYNVLRSEELSLSDILLPTFESELSSIHLASIRRNHKVISVRKLVTDPVPVYDLTVDKYHNFALSSGVFVHNTGKSTVAVIALYYKIYTLMCMRNPQQFYGLMDGSPIIFGMFNILKYLASDVSFRYFMTYLDMSPYFKDRCRSLDGREKFIGFPHHIGIAVGAQAIHVLGQNVMGGNPLVGSMEIPLLDGRSVPIRDLTREASIWVYGQTPDGKMIPAEATAFYSGDYEVLELLLDSGDVLRCAAHHPWMLRDGSYKTAEELSPGDSLMPFEHRLDDRGYSEFRENSTGVWCKTHQAVAYHVYGPNIYKDRVAGEGQNVIHHLDLIKRNNRPDNLVVMTFKDHQELHTRYVELMHSPESRARWADSMNKRYEDPEFRERRSRISRETMLRLWEEKRREPTGKYRDIGEAVVRYSRSDISRETKRKMCIERNATEYMKHISGQRMAEWNQRNPEELKRRGLELGSKNKARLDYDEEYRERFRAASSRNMTSYNKSKRYEFTLEDMRAHSAAIVSSGENLTLGSLMSRLALVSSSALYIRLNEAGISWPEFKDSINHKIVSIKRTGQIEPMYCLNVPSTHNYAVSAGVYSHNCDEAAFGKGSSLSSDERSQIEDLYLATRRRIDSRFMQKGGLNPGLLILSSSPKSQGDFMSTHMASVSSDKHTHISDFPYWVVHSHKFVDSNTFRVMVGDRSRSSRILRDDEPSPDNAEVLAVPMEFHEQFRRDLDNCIRDIAGRPTYGHSLLLPRRESLADCLSSSTPRSHPFSVEILELSIEPDDLTSPITALEKSGFLLLVDKVRNSYRPMYHPNMSRWVHVDLAKNGDCAGIAMGGISRVVEIERYDKDNNKYTTQDYVYFIDLCLCIRAVAGSEIDFSKIREFIFYLRDCSFNISGVSYDGFQSVASLQDLYKAGFKVNTTSVDRTTDPYFLLRSVIVEKRLDLYEYPILLDELSKLRDHSRAEKYSGPKIDHPTKGSKDQSDAVCGVVWNLLKLKNSEAQPDEKPPAIPDVSVTDGLEDDSWLQPKKQQSLASLFDD